MAAGSARRCGPSSRRGRQGPGDRRLGRARGGAPDRRGDRGASSAAAAASTTSRSWSAPSSRPASSRTASSPSACPTASSAASASTSAPRSATRSPICASSPSPPTTSPSSASSTPPSAASATRRWPRSTRSPAPQGVPLFQAAAQILDTDELTPQARRVARQPGRRLRPLARAARRAAPCRARPAGARRKRLHRHAPGRPLAPRAPAGSRTSPSSTRAMEEYETLGAFLEHVSLVMDNDARARRRTRSRS